MSFDRIRDWLGDKTPEYGTYTGKVNKLYEAHIRSINKKNLFDTEFSVSGPDRVDVRPEGIVYLLDGNPGVVHSTGEPKNFGNIAKYLNSELSGQSAVALEEVVAPNGLSLGFVGFYAGNGQRIGVNAFPDPDDSGYDVLLQQM